MQNFQYLVIWFAELKIIIKQKHMFDSKLNVSLLNNFEISVHFSL